MLDRVGFNLRERCGVSAGGPGSQPLLAAVSGGADSLALLDALWRLGVPLIVAHLNHGLRPEADDDAAIARSAAEERGVPFVEGRADAGAHARQYSLSIEEAARDLRYRFLFESAAQAGAQAVATGHNADDQAETVLMHLLRGSGPAGLSGMAFRSLPNPWSDALPLVRPLLDVWRVEIDAYGAERGLTPAQDATNQDRRFYRNRLRLEALPYLEQLNPGVKARLLQMADVIGEEDRLLDQLALAAWEKLDARSGPGSLSLDAAALAAQPAALQRRLVRLSIARLRAGLRDIDFETVERARRFLADPPRTRQADLAAGLRLRLEEGRLWLADWEAELPSGEFPQVETGRELDFELPGRLALGNGWVMEAQVIPGGEAGFREASRNADDWRAYLDLSRLGDRLQVRGRLEGELFQPLGLGGRSLKLSDFMINRQVPRRARDGWPLLASYETVIWVPGHRISELFAVSPETEQIAVVRLKREDGA